MVRFLKKIKSKRRLKMLRQKENYILESINRDRQSMNAGENIAYTSYFYRNLENQEMELADIQDEIRTIKKYLKVRK